VTERRPSLPDRVLAVYREKGLPGVWYAALARAGVRRLVVFERSLAAPLAAIAPPAGVTIRTLGPADEEAYAPLGQETAATFRRRLAAGHECWGAWCEGALRHVSWLAFSEVEVEHVGCRLLLADDVAYPYHSFTQQAYRGRGLSPARQVRSLAELRRRGFVLVVCAVAPENRSAFPPVRKLGYHGVGTITSVRVGAWCRVWCRLDAGAVAHGWRLDRTLGAARPAMAKTGGA